MAGLQWKTVGVHVVPFSTVDDVDLAHAVSALVVACDNGWKFLSEKVQVLMEPGHTALFPHLVTGEPVPNMRNSWQRTVRLGALLRLIACTLLANVVDLACVLPAKSMDATQELTEAGTTEGFVAAKFIERRPDADKMSASDLRDVVVAHWRRTKILFIDLGPLET